MPCTNEYQSISTHWPKVVLKHARNHQLPNYCLTAQCLDEMVDDYDPGRELLQEELTGCVSSHFSYHLRVSLLQPRTTPDAICPAASLTLLILQT